MKHAFFGALVTAACLATAAPAQADTARDMYTRAMAQERQVRDAATKPTLAQMRHVVALYEGVVRKHPASGYCDNALWQAANIAALAYEQFGDEADRRTATRLLSQLKSEYPSSKLIAQVPDTLANMDRRASPPPDSDPRPASVAPTPPKPAVTDSAPKARPEPVPAGAPAALTSLKDVKRTVLPDGVRITVELEAEAPYHQEEIENPRRLFFDFKNVKAASGLQDTSLRFDDDVVREIRLGRHPQNTTRLVVDLDGVSAYTVYPLYGPYRLVIDLRRMVASTPLATKGTAPIAPEPPPVVKIVAAAPPPAPPAIVQPKSGLPTYLPAAPAPWIPTPPPPAAIERPEANGPALSERPEAKGPGLSERPESKGPGLSERSESKAVPSLPPAANSNGKFSISRQLGLGVSRIVIDAGHGGHDPGAHGTASTRRS